MTLIHEFSLFCIQKAVGPVSSQRMLEIEKAEALKYHLQKGPKVMLEQEQPHVVKWTDRAVHIHLEWES